MPPIKSQSGKRPRKVLSIKEKLELINDYSEQGISVKCLSQNYGVGIQTVYDLLKNREKYVKLCSKNNSLHDLKERRTLKMSVCPKVDAATYEWYRQESRKGTTITGEMIIKKAKSLHIKFRTKAKCKYSSGWLDKFKKRHGISRQKSLREKGGADFVSATKFANQLEELMQNEDLTTEQIYNVYETSLFWKCLPQNPLASVDEFSPEGQMDSKEKVTALICANAAGTHKCELMVIGKSARPRGLKNVDDLPVIYKASKGATLTQELFLEWFKGCFVPEVRKHLQLIGLKKSCKVLLLLDNSPAHGTNVNFEIFENIIVKYFPQNCTSLIQPMDQGVTQSFKGHYQRLLGKKLAGSIDETSVDFKSALWTAANSWDAVTPQVLRNGWNSLIAREENDPLNTPEIILPACTNDGITTKMECDIDSLGFVSEEEVVSSVQGTQEYEVESDASEERCTEEIPTLAQAIEASKVVLRFMDYSRSPDISDPEKKIQMYRLQISLLKELKRKKAKKNKC